MIIPARRSLVTTNSNNDHGRTVKEDESGVEDPPSTSTATTRNARGGTRRDCEQNLVAFPNNRAKAGDRDRPTFPV